MVRILQQHQAYAAYWHLKTERLGWKEYPAYGASINADKPGFGKVSGNSRMRVSEIAWKSCGSAAKAHKLWSKFDHDGLKKLDGLIKSRNKDVQDRSMTTWSTFERHVCIQRTRMSTWNGEVIQHVPRMRWRLITVHMRENDKKLASVLLGRLGKEVSTSKGKVTATSVYSSSIYEKLRVCATWPAVAKKLVNGQITLGKSEMLKWGVFAEGKTRKENSRASNREPSIRSLPIWDARHMTAPKFVQLRVILESDQRAAPLR